MSFLTTPISLSTVFPNNRMIDTISVDVIMSEVTNDTLTITKQPVQQGATISDHAFKEPVTLTMVIYMKDNVGLFSVSNILSTLTNSSNALAQIYAKLLNLQLTFTPIVVTTPKRIYKNMLISSISNTTDKNTENTLSLSISFQEVIIVNVTTAIVPPSKQKRPGSTQATQNVGNKSALLNLVQGANPNIQGFIK